MHGTEMCGSCCSLCSESERHLSLLTVSRLLWRVVVDEFIEILFLRNGSHATFPLLSLEASGAHRRLPTLYRSVTAASAAALSVQEIGFVSAYCLRD